MKNTYLLKVTYLLALAAVCELLLTIGGNTVIGALAFYVGMAAAFAGIIFGIVGFFGKERSENGET